MRDIYNILLLITARPDVRATLGRIASVTRANRVVDVTEREGAIYWFYACKQRFDVLYIGFVF